MAHTLRRANAGSFKPGNPGGPGRPAGARTKLNELALTLLSEDFAKHGAEVIAQVRKKKPESYLTGVLSLLPKQSQVEKLNPFSELSDAELDRLEEYIAGMRAKTVTQLELVANNEEAAVQPSAEEKDATRPIHEAK